MKNIIYLILVLLISSCAPALLTDTWKNPEIPSFAPEKIMVIGVTQNTTARMKYEQALKNEFNVRGISASQSGLVFEDSFKDAKQSEEDIAKQVEKLVSMGYDAILISAVKGIDERVTYNEGMPQTYFYLRRFGRHYYLFQDVYFDPGYYNNYKVYHIETAIYNIKPNAKKDLVWVGSYDLVNPNDVSSSVRKYVNTVVRSLEQENLIPIKN